MKTLLILLGIHLIMVLSAFALAKAAKETQWWLFIGVAVIPFIGPILIIIAYVLQAAEKKDREEYQEQKLKSQK